MVTLKKQVDIFGTIKPIKNVRKFLTLLTIFGSAGSPPLQPLKKDRFIAYPFFVIMFEG